MVNCHKAFLAKVNTLTLAKKQEEVAPWNRWNRSYHPDISWTFIVLYLLPLKFVHICANFFSPNPVPMTHQKSTVSHTPDVLFTGNVVWQMLSQLWCSCPASVAMSRRQVSGNISPTNQLRPSKQSKCPNSSSSSSSSSCPPNSSRRSSASQPTQVFSLSSSSS